MIACAVMNAAGAKKEGGNHFTIDDFMPKSVQEEEENHDLAMMKRLMVATMNFPIEDKLVSLGRWETE